MGLADYRQKRRFERTAEPKGKSTTSASGWRFVVQQHAARSLHFDFRLELDGVLKSWAVPKGVSLDPADRRLAVHVEDHPIEYGAFEGVIPKGEYGAGAVIVWDHGKWEPIGDAQSSYDSGKLKFRLCGEKLAGAWMLVRMRPRPEDRADNWLLIKERDEAAIPGHGSDIIRERPDSVLSGRTLAEVAAGVKASAKRKNSSTKSQLAAIRSTSGAKAAELPKSLEPALAQRAGQPPAGDDWLHEIKFDGYRLLAWLDHGKVQLRTRQGHDWTNRFPEIATAIERLPANLAILDGEVVAVSPDGRSSFASLQQALSKRGTGGLVFHVFDTPYLEGFDLRQVGLESRKALLQTLLVKSKDPRVQYVDHIIGGGADFFSHCRQLGLEGIMSKRRTSPYREGRSDNWLKIKCVHAEPFVIGGYTTARGASPLRALLVGHHDDRGRLMYAGRVGSGFSEQSAADLEQRFQSIGRSESPFADPVPKESGRTFHWVRPQLVAQVRYAGWTAEGLLWHPTFEALRNDTEPTEVVREDHGGTTGEQKRTDRPQAGRSRKAVNSPVPRKLRDELAEVRLTNPQKVMYPDLGLTKLDLAGFYIQIADWILPHLVNRPLSLVRCPDGQQGHSFFQKHAGPEMPSAVHRIPLTDDGQMVEHLYIRDLKGLVSLVQVSALEIHVWGARVDDVDRPDRLVIDLDPDEAVPFARVIEAAHRVRERLHDAGLTSFVKTTGGKGLHVVTPLERRQGWADVKQFTKRLAEGMAADYPQSYTASMSKRARSGRIYIDYVRNSRGATAVAPYSTRARPRAPVAVPVAWEELTATLLPDSFHMNDLATRLSKLTTDPWEDMADVRQSLTRAVQKRLR